MCTVYAMAKVLKVKITIASIVLLCLIGSFAYVLPRSATKTSNASVEAFMLEASLCYNTQNPPACFNDLVIEKLPAYGLESVVEGYTKFISKDTKSIKEQCHRSAHYLGEYAGRHSKNVDNALSAGGSFCQFGYYHGVIEGYSLVTPTLWEELPHLCSKITTDVESTVYGECVHSLGHAIVTRTKYDIPQGLEKCSLLPAYREQTSCGTGIFMSWSNELDRRLSSSKPVTQEFTQVNKDARWEMCPKLEELMQEPCVQFFAETTDMTIESFLKYVNWCTATFQGNENVVSSCHRGVGRVAGGEAGFAKVGSWPGVVSLCTSFTSEEHVNECTSAAYSTASGFFAGQDMYTPACAAWDKDPRKSQQCELIQKMYTQVNKEVVIGQ